MWPQESIFYHIYPIGFCQSPKFNDYTSEPIFRLAKVYEWLPHLKQLGINAIYFGPIFESCSHGYDTKNYHMVDRRLGTNQYFAKLVSDLHQLGFRVIIDAVFNHVGRDFWAFEDVKQKKSNSAYCSWFKLNFDHDNHYHDGFCYEGWDGCDNLVKLNLSNPEVRSYLINTAIKWIDNFDIDGLRIDVAHYLPISFLRKLNKSCIQRKSEFWSVGEIVFGNYAKLVNPTTINSCTNYELYKALHSSCNSLNMHELAHTLKRQFSSSGVYKDLHLYNFLDNHDVNYIASELRDPNQLKPIYSLLFSLPGVPSVYYGSEWGAKGNRSKNDSEVRPYYSSPIYNDLCKHIEWWAKFRLKSKCLTQGNYKEIFVSEEILVFERNFQDQQLNIAINISSSSKIIEHNKQKISLKPYETIIL